MKKFWIQITALTLIIFGGFYFYKDPTIFYLFFPENAPVVMNKLKLGENVINVEIADTADERSRGLGGREKLASDTGMLFVFSESKVYRFWMKDMKIPIDIIFISQGKVVDFLKNIPPPASNQKDSDLPVLSPSLAVDMVLEVNSNYIDSRGVKVGDNVSLIQ